MVTGRVLALVGLVFFVVLGVGCDRSDATLTIDEDGAASWSRVVTFTRDGQWADDFDYIRDEAVANQDTPDTFVGAVLPVVLQLSGLTDQEWEEATAATMEFTNLNITTTDDSVAIAMSRSVDDLNDLASGLVPGRFSLTADGHQRYSIDDNLQVRSLLPLDATVDAAVGDRGWGGDTAFTFTVPGTLISHNAHEVVGADSDGTTLRWDWLTASRDDGAVDVTWDPTGSPATDSGWNGRRIGLLAVAALALIVGTAVLLTFKPPGFDDD